MAEIPGSRRSRRLTGFPDFYSFPRAAASGIRRHRDLGHFVVQVGGRDDAVVEVAEIELLVRCMRVLVGQPDTEQYGRQPKLLLKRRYDRNRTAFACEHRLAAKAELD